MMVTISSLPPRARCLPMTVIHGWPAFAVHCSLLPSICIDFETKNVFFDLFLNFFRIFGVLAFFVFHELVLRAQKELEAVATRVGTARPSSLRKSKNPSFVLKKNKSRQGSLKVRCRSASAGGKGLRIPPY